MQWKVIIVKIDHKFGVKEQQRLNQLSWTSDYYQFYTKADSMKINGNCIHMNDVIRVDISALLLPLMRLFFPQYLNISLVSKVKIL